MRNATIKKASSFLSKEKVRKLDELYLRPERRQHERFSSNVQARIFFGKMIYSGMVTNVSKSGMFVSTKVNFPVNAEFMMVLLLNNRTVKIPIKVRRRVDGESNDFISTESGIGVELFDAPQNYLDYIGADTPPGQFRDNSFYHSQS
jgi:Tfp pilus assembly protein PilZ